MKDKRYVKTLFNIVRFIVEKDFPHQFPSFSQFVQRMIEEVNLDITSVTIFKQLKEVIILALRSSTKSGRERAA